MWRSTEPIEGDDGRAGGQPPTRAVQCLGDLGRHGSRAAGDPKANKLDADGLPDVAGAGAGAAVGQPLGPQN